MKGSTLKIVAGRMTSTIACPGVLACTGRLTAFALPARAAASSVRRIALATGALSISAAQTKTVRLRTTKSGSRWLRAHHPRRGQLQVQLTGGSGKTVTKVLRLVRRPR